MALWITKTSMPNREKLESSASENIVCALLKSVLSEVNKLTIRSGFELFLLSSLFWFTTISVTFRANKWVQHYECLLGATVWKCTLLLCLSALYDGWLFTPPLSGAIGNSLIADVVRQNVTKIRPTLFFRKITQHGIKKPVSPSYRVLITVCGCSLFYTVINYYLRLPTVR